MSVLLGPTDAGNFRVKVGRYGDRWYTDPLEACPIAPAVDWVGPSVSATKPPFANKYVPMKAIAEMSDAEWLRLSSVPTDERYEAVKAHDKRTSRVNMDRGSIVHQHAEDRLRGRTPLPLPESWAPGARDQAATFIPALDSFFDTYQPELIAAEVVCLHRELNGVGYGGTADAFVKIEGDIWAVDWKSRLSDHGAYMEEAAQGGAYVGAQYMIVAGPDGAPVRAPMPDVAGVLIVSIRPDGFRAYPIDRDGAVAIYADMHRWWAAQRRVTDNKIIGKPWAPKVVGAVQPTVTPKPEDDATPTPSVDRSMIVERTKALVEGGHANRLAIAWPPGVPGFKSDHAHTDAELDLILAAVRRLEDETNAPFHPADYTPTDAAADETPTPEPKQVDPLDDGPVVDDATRDALNAAFGALNDTQREWVKQIHATVNGHTTPTGNPHVRQWSILRAAVEWAAVNDPDETIVRDIAATVLGDDLWRSMDIDDVFANLTASQADELAGYAQQIARGTAVVEHQHDRWTIRPAA